MAKTIKFYILKTKIYVLGTILYDQFLFNNIALNNLTVNTLFHMIQVFISQHHVLNSVITWPEVSRVYGK